MTDQENTAASDPMVTQAIRCDLWPEWLGELVEKAADVYVEKYDMSTEQAVAYGILLALESRRPEAVKAEREANIAAVLAVSDTILPVVEEALKAETRVRRLMWEDCGEDMGFCCDTILGRYWIEPDALASKSWQLRLVTIEHGTEETRILAQGHITVDTLHPVAQADFTARILSNLSSRDVS